MARFANNTGTSAPSTLTIFYDGRNSQLAQAMRGYQAGTMRRRDLLWRDLRTCPDALALFGVPRTETPSALFVVDRRARLRRGLDARIKLWEALPRWRVLTWLFTVIGVKALVARPITRGHP
jgi:predicted DCC family thiol-disulfide oxidoreductase YuxK